MRTYLLVGLVLLVGLSTRSQDLTPLYEANLPDSPWSNPTLRAQAFSILEQRRSIHPELIYPTLLFFSQMYSEDPVIPGLEPSEMGQFITRLTNRYLLARHSWATQESLNVPTHLFDAEIRNLIMGRLSPYFNSNSTDTTHHLDSLALDPNRIDYFVWQSLSIPPSFASYDSREDYSSKRATAEQLCRSRLYSELSAASPDDKATPQAIVSRVIDKWFLFAATGEPLVPRLVAFLRGAGTTNSRPKAFWGISLIPWNASHSIEHSISINGSSVPLTMHKRFQMFSLGIVGAYRQYVRDYYGFLSYIDLQGSLVFQLSPTRATLPSGYTVTYFQPPYYDEESISLREGSIKTSNMFSLSFHAATPVLMLAGRHPIELGFQAGVTHTSYQLQYTYQRVFTAGWIISGTQVPTDVSTVLTSSDDRDSNRSQWSPFILPTISLLYQVTDNLEARVSFAFSLSSLAFRYSF